MEENPYEAPKVPYENAGNNPDRQAKPIGCAVLLVVGALMLVGLFLLQRMPLRQPHNINAWLHTGDEVLDGESVIAVRVIIGIILVPWLAGMIWLVRTLRRPRQIFH